VFGHWIDLMQPDLSRRLRCCQSRYFADQRSDHLHLPAGTIQI
jgi:hypothetical protein